MENVRVTYGLKSSYNHLKPNDEAIWERFIKAFPNAYTEVIYDLAVGQGAQIPQGTEPALAKDFTLLNQKKIDVVGFNGDNIDIIEVKPRASFSAIGQIVGYRTLYLNYVDPNAKVRAVILTDALLPDMALLAEEHNVKILIV